MHYIYCNITKRTTYISSKSVRNVQEPGLNPRYVLSCVDTQYRKLDAPQFSPRLRSQAFAVSKPVGKRGAWLKAPPIIRKGVLVIANGRESRRVISGCRRRGDSVVHNSVSEWVTFLSTLPFTQPPNSPLVWCGIDQIQMPYQWCGLHFNDSFKLVWKFI